MSKHYTIAAILIIVLATTCALPFTSAADAVSTLYLWLAILSIDIGITLALMGLYSTYKLQWRGLESLSKQDRKEIESAYNRGNLPENSTLQATAKAHAQIQLKLIRQYTLTACVSAVGLLLIFLGMNLLFSSDEVGFFRYFSPTNIINSLLPVFINFRSIQRIRSNAEYLGDPSENREPPEDDNRWWTGRW